MEAKRKGIQETKAAWQESYDYELTDEDALEIDANLLAFITVLLEWEQDQPDSNDNNENDTTSIK